MELALKKESVAYCACVFEKSVKQNLDLGWNLPDYCSDIRRILQCTVTPCISGVSVGGGRVSAVGEVQVRLVYLNDRGCIDAFCETAELSASAELTCVSEDALVLSSAAVDYINARAASPRRFTVSGAVSVLFRAFQKQQQPLLCGVESCGGQTRTAQVPCLSLLSCAEKTFDLSETVELPEQVMPVEKLLRASGTLRVDSTKAVSGKLLLRGELAVTLFYLAAGEGQELLHYEHRLPISQIIEVPGLEEESFCDVFLRLQCLRVLPRADSTGEVRLLDIASLVSAFVKVYEKKTQCVVTDCYATQLSLRVQRQEVSFFTHLQTVDRTAQVQNTVEPAEQGVRAVEDVSVSQVHCSVRVQEDGTTAEGEATVHLLCRLEDSSFVHVERGVTFSLPLGVLKSVQDVTGTLNCVLHAAQTQIRGNAVDVTLDFRTQGELFGVQKQTVCVDAAEETEAQQRRRSSLTLYFAQQGEALWDIAKHYRTSVAAIQAENELEGDTVPEERMLLVPRV